MCPWSSSRCRSRIHRYGMAPLHPIVPNARHGLNIVTNDNPEKARAIVNQYKKIWSEQRRAGPVPKIGLVRFIVVADNDAEAMTIARRAYLRWRSSFVYLSAL